jgi:membrane associated rhomboid family serine protease
MGRIRISYNAPVVLTFALLAVAVYCLGYAVPETKLWFAAWPKMHDARSYIGLVSHILGHGSWEHLLGNFMLILLLGPLLEERFGSFQLFVMILITALVTGVVNLALGGTFLVGASGIVFMMILLASTANIRQGEIPLTFIAVAVIYLGGEVVRAFNNDNISQMAHLVGGVVGGAFGFISARGKAIAIAPGKDLGLGIAAPRGKPLAKPKS